MSTLYGNNISQTYQGLIKLADSTTGVTSTTQSFQDGLGNNLPIQVSTDTVNISGSFLVNGLPVTFTNTGSFATTGSNTFIGDQTITGSVNQTGTFYADAISFLNSPSIEQTTGAYVMTYDSNGTVAYDTYPNIASALQPYIETGSFNRDGLITTGSVGQTQSITGSLEITDTITANSASFNYLHTIYETASIIYSSGSNQLGDESNDTQTLWGTVKIPSGPVSITGSLYVSSSVQKDVIIDGQLWVSSSLNTASGTTTQAQINVVGWGNSGGNSRSGSVQITPQRITLTRDTNNSSFGTTTIDPFYGITQITNGVGTGGNYLQGSGSVSNTIGVQDPTFSYYNFQQLQVNSTGSLWSDYDYDVDVYSPYMKMDANFGNNNPAPEMLRGLRVTGSLNVSGSVNTKGSLNVNNSTVNTGSLTNVGDVYILNQTYTSGSVKFNITGSNSVSSSNLIFGPPISIPATVTGSIVISGSNNILTNGLRSDTTAQGTYGHINGNINLVNVVPVLSTGSLVKPNTNQNILNGQLTLNFITSSTLPIPNINSNIINGFTNIQHTSGSIAFSQNIVMGNGLNSNAGTTRLGLQTTMAQNLIAGLNTVTLNHNSSSITYNGNIGGGMTVTNNYTSSVSSNVNNIQVQGNIFNGAGNQIIVSGSNTANRRLFVGNTIFGQSNTINSNYSGSTAGMLYNTAIMGDNLIVSASQTSGGNGGALFIGRYNATGSNQETSNDNIFVVGAGTSDADRKNAFRIDNNRNSTFTGSVQISGSLFLNGVAVNSDRNGLITTGSAGTTQSITGSLIVSGGLNVTGGITGSIDKTGLITTGSYLTGDQTIQGTLKISGSASQPLQILAGDNTARIDILNGGPAFYRNSNTYNTVIGNAKGLEVGFTGSNNMLFTGFFLGFSSGSNNTVISGGGGANFRSGSYNVIIGTPNNLEYGNNNTFIGVGSDNPLAQDTLKIGTNGTSIIEKISISGSLVLKNNGLTDGIVLSGSAVVDSTLKVRGTINDLYITGSNGNIAISQGQNNVLRNSPGGKNIGIGDYSLSGLIEGEGNIAIGDRALEQLNGKNNNLAIGNSALRFSQGQFNTAIGATALINNISGSLNFGLGYNTLGANTSGDANLGIGTQTLVNNVNGSSNLGLGNNSLTYNVSGSGNIAIGNSSGYNETGNNNFYIGNQNYGSVSNDRSKSLVWGVLDNTTANQTLQINAKTTIKDNLVVTGSLNISGSLNVKGDINSTNIVNSITGRTMIYGGTGGSGATPRLYISGSDGANTTIGRSFYTVDSTMVNGLNGGMSVYGAPNTQPYIGLGVYTPNTFDDDYELLIVSSTGGTQFQDFDNFNTFNYEDFLVIPPNVGDSPAPQFTRGLGITGSLNVSGKTSIANAMNLTPMDPLPTGVVGDLAVSGSSLYFYNGDWTLIV